MCKTNKDHAGSLDGVLKTADMQAALGMDDGHAESYLACLSKINISPSSQCVYLLIYSAQVCILWQNDNLETAMGRHTVQRPHPETGHRAWSCQKLA